MPRYGRKTPVKGAGAQEAAVSLRAAEGVQKAYAGAAEAGAQAGPVALQGGLQVRQQKGREQEAAAQQELAQKQLEQRGQIAAGQQDIARQGMALKAADLGLEKAGPQGPGQMEEGQQGPPSPDQQRLAEQGKQPLEFAGHRYVPGQERKAGLGIRQAEARAKELTAEAAFTRAKTGYVTARSKGDLEAAARHETAMFKAMDRTQAQLNSLMESRTTGILDARTLGQIQSTLKDSPDPELQRMFGGGEPNLDRLIQVTSGQLARQKIAYYASGGKGIMEMDPTHPVTQDFNNMQIQVGEMLSSIAAGGAAPSGMQEMTNRDFMEYAGLNTAEGRNQFIREVAADVMSARVSARGDAGDLAAPPVYEQGMAQMTDALQRTTQENESLRQQLEQLRGQLGEQGQLEPGQMPGEDVQYGDRTIRRRTITEEGGRRVLERARDPERKYEPPRPRTYADWDREQKR